MTTPPGMVDIEVELTEEQVTHLVLAGMFKWVEGYVLEITPQGSKWLQEWCAAEMAKHEAKP